MDCNDFIKNYPLPISSKKTIEERTNRMQLNFGRYLYSIHAPPSNFKETRSIQQLHRVLHDLMRIIYSAPVTYLKSNKSSFHQQINSIKKKLTKERYATSLMHKLEKLEVYLKKH